MNAWKSCIAALLLAAATVAVAQQPPPGPPPQQEPLDGPWMTPRMMSGVINRITEEMVNVYNFNDEQLEQTRMLFKQRFPGWLQQNRAQIQPLLNQYFEALLADDPPSVEEVATWAARVQPILEDFNGLVHQTAEDMRSYMNDDQQLILAGQIAAMDVGMNFARQRIESWKQGGYDPNVDWPRSKDFQGQQDERERQLKMQAEIAREAAMGRSPPAGAGAPDGVAVGPPKPLPAKDPLDATATDDWTAYTEAFIRRYKLNEEQQNRARQTLTVKLEERERYLRDKANEIKRIDEQFKVAQTDDQRQRVAADLDKVRKPLEQKFQQLKDRLDKLPTPTQKKAAIKGDKPSPAKPEQAPKAEPTAEPGGAEQKQP